jgi:hypothetical protein
MTLFDAATSAHTYGYRQRLPISKWWSFASSSPSPGLSAKWSETKRYSIYATSGFQQPRTGLRERAWHTVPGSSRVPQQVLTPVPDLKVEEKKPHSSKVFISKLGANVPEQGYMFLHRFYNSVQASEPILNAHLL